MEPLGLKPENEHNLVRIKEILEASFRYYHNDKDIPIQWIEEMLKLLRKNKQLTNKRRVKYEK